MPQPTPQDMHVDAILSEFAMRYMNADYIAERSFNVVPVKKQSDKYFKFDKGAWFRDEAAVRAPTTESKASGYTLSTDNYFADEWAIHTLVPQEAFDNADDPLNPEQDAVDFCMNLVKLRIERLLGTKVMTAANWAANNSEDAAGLWAAGGGNTFIADMEAGIEAILKNTGKRPNMAIMDPATLLQIKQETTVLDRIKYTERGIVTAQLIASLFDLDEVLIGSAVYSSAGEKADASDFTPAYIWETNAGKGSCLLYYKDRGGPSARSVDSVKSFEWKGGDGYPKGARSFWVTAPRSLWIETFHRLDAKIVGNDLGYLFWDTHTT